MTPLIAETDPTTIGLVVQSLTALLLLALTGLQLMRGATGKDGERQIEPTAIHAISNELRAQTETLNNINREVGEVKTTVDIVKKDVDGFHQRIGGVSRELAAASARIEGLERREA